MRGDASAVTDATAAFESAVARGARPIMEPTVIEDDRGCIKKATIGAFGDGRIREWLLGSTILCQSCGCLWLVPAAQKDDSYLCRQCGSQVTSKPQPVPGDQPNKRANR